MRTWGAGAVFVHAPTGDAMHRIGNQKCLRGWNGADGIVARSGEFRGGVLTAECFVSFRFDEP